MVQKKGLCNDSRVVVREGRQEVDRDQRGQIFGGEKKFNFGW